MYSKVFNSDRRTYIILWCFYQAPRNGFRLLAFSNLNNGSITSRLVLNGAVYASEVRWCRNFRTGLPHLLRVHFLSIWRSWSRKLTPHADQRYAVWTTVLLRCLSAIEKISIPNRNIHCCTTNNIISQIKRWSWELTYIWSVFCGKIFC